MHQGCRDDGDYQPRRTLPGEETAFLPESDLSPATMSERRGTCKPSNAGKQARISFLFLSRARRNLGRQSTIQRVWLLTSSGKSFSNGWSHTLRNFFEIPESPFRPHTGAAGYRAMVSTLSKALRAKGARAMTSRDASHLARKQRFPPGAISSMRTRLRVRAYLSLPAYGADVGDLPSKAGS